MQRKKVAILLPWLRMGGTNKVALRFIKELSEYCDVTLVLSKNEGELLGDIPKGVHLIIDEMTSFKHIFRGDFRKFRLWKLVKDFVYYLNIKVGRDSIDNYKYIVRRHDLITNDTFDCAISYHGQSPERLLNLIYRINAKKKVAWIHGEMSFSKDNCRRMAKYYKKMDHLYFVSKHTQESFMNSIGITDIKSDVYYNPLNADEIRELAKTQADVCFSNDSFNIVTVGRISKEKGQDMIPSIVKDLLEKECPVQWYLVGDGPAQESLENSIKKHNLEDYIHLLGVKNNPYCYMKMSDLYVQPSYTEGYSTTICEAGILGKAIVGTKPSGGIRDQICDNQDGLIVDATVEGIAEGILRLYQNESLKKQFEQNIVKKNFEGKGEIDKFLQFLNS